MAHVRQPPLAIQPRLRRALTIALIVLAATGLLLAWSPARWGILRGSAAVVLGCLCLLVGISSVARRVWSRNAVLGWDTRRTQQGAMAFVCVVLFNLAWFLGSTLHSGSGETTILWVNVVVDTHNAVQCAAMILALGLITTPTGALPIDRALLRWSAAFTLVLATNYLALLDTHWQWLHRDEERGGSCLTHEDWLQWRLTNGGTIVAYCLGAILVLHGRSLRWVCVAGVTVTGSIGIVLWICRGWF